MKKILAFAGSNSKNSINQKLVVEAAKFLDGAEVILISLRDYEAPVYGIDHENEIGFPPKMVKLHKLFQEVDGFLVGVPEHNGSMPAVLKNSLDWVSRQGGRIFQNKPVAFIGTSPGKRGAASAMKHILEIMPHRGAEIVGHYSLPDFNEHFHDGVFDSFISDDLKVLMDKLIKAVK